MIRSDDLPLAALREVEKCAKHMQFTIEDDMVYLEQLDENEIVLIRDPMPEAGRMALQLLVDKLADIAKGELNESEVEA